MNKPVSIMGSRKPEADDFAHHAWGPDFLREVDLVIAASEYEAVKNGVVLTDDVLCARVADFCAPLDKDCTPEFIGVVRVPAVYTTADETMRRHHDDLASRPRGAWAIWQSEAGGYDIWMSTGLGQIITPSGNKFQYTHPESAYLSFRVGYGAVLSLLIYTRRNAIRKAMINASIAAAGLKPGTTFRNISMAGAHWTNVRFIGIETNYYVGNTDAYRMNLSRRGRRREVVIEGSALRTIASLPLLLPTEFQDPANNQRLKSLHEHRAVAAQNCWPTIETTLGFDAQYGCKAQFLVDGDLWKRTVFNDRNPAGIIQVEFAPGSDQVVDASYQANAVLRRAA